MTKPPYSMVRGCDLVVVERRRDPLVLFTEDGGVRLERLLISDVTLTPLEFTLNWLHRRYPRGRRVWRAAARLTHGTPVPPSSLGEAAFRVDRAPRGELLQCKPRRDNSSDNLAEGEPFVIGAHIQLGED